jgi:Asp-tRNA(Asn)/Glu-tRNA(Gln) amidotransferase C subunit
MTEAALIARLQLAQQQTEEAEAKIQRIIDLVKQSKIDEEAVREDEKKIFRFVF